MWHFVLWHLLTRQSIDQRWPLIIILLLWESAVLPVHLTDWGGAFPGDLATIVFIKQHLIHQVRLNQVGLCRRLRGPIVVTLQSKRWEEQREEEKRESRGKRLALKQYYHKQIRSHKKRSWSAVQHVNKRYRCAINGTISIYVMWGKETQAERSSTVS